MLEKEVENKGTKTQGKMVGSAEIEKVEARELFSRNSLGWACGWKKSRRWMVERANCTKEASKLKVAESGRENTWRSGKPEE